MFRYMMALVLALATSVSMATPVKTTTVSDGPEYGLIGAFISGTGDKTTIDFKMSWTDILGFDPYKGDKALNIYLDGKSILDLGFGTSSASYEGFLGAGLHTVSYWLDGYSFQTSDKDLIKAFKHDVDTMWFTGLKISVTSPGTSFPCDPLPPVSSVPEPSTYALILGGLAMIAFIHRRRVTRRK